MSQGRSADPFDPSARPPQPAGPATFLDDDPSNLRPVEPTKSGGGRCLLWGCLALVVLFLVLIIGGGFGAYWFYTSQLNKFTDDQPAEIPVVEATEEEVQAIQQRIDAFESIVMPEDASNADAGDPGGESEAAEQTGAADPDENADDVAVENTPEPLTELVLTSDELNALIAGNEQLRGRVFVDIVDGEITGKVSIPTDMLPGGKGRFFNADGRFDVSMQDGVLVVRLVGGSVKGEPIPEPIMEAFAQENLAKELYKNEQNARVLRKFESIEVGEDSILLKLREPAKPRAVDVEQDAAELAP
ncbi:MAG: hypothetical protein AAF745_14860 [Planctomycetota bacterium]